MTSLKDLKTKGLKDAKVKAAYDRLEDEYALAAALIDARAKAKLTQSQLARRMGTTQSAIARLESGRALPSARPWSNSPRRSGERCGSISARRRAEAP